MEALQGTWQGAPPVWPRQSSSGQRSRCSTLRWSWLSALSALWWALERRPLAFVPDKVQVVDVALVTLMKADLVLRPLVLELPVGW